MHIACTFHARNFGPGLRSAPVAADVLDLHEGLHAEAGALAAEAGLLKLLKGIGAPVTLVRLTATMPNCSARLRR